jgi:hypothetical protein
VNDDFWHSLTHPSQAGKGRSLNKLGNLLDSGKAGKMTGSTGRFLAALGMTSSPDLSNKPVTRGARTSCAHP